MFCNTCGADNEEGAAVCETCGAPLAAPAVSAPESERHDATAVEPPMSEMPAPIPVEAAAPVAVEVAPPIAAPSPVLCTACGAQNAPGYRFCKNCGISSGETGTAIPVAHPDVPVSASAGAAMLGFLKSRGAAAALLGAAIGIAFILIAAVLVRPVYMGSNTAYLSSLPAAQAQAVRSTVDKVYSVPLVAASVNLPAEAVKIHVSVGGSAIDGSLDIQAPVTTWNALGALAMALAAFLSVLIAKPLTAREAVLQGSVTCVPYTLGVVAIALTASVPMTIDLSSLGLPAAYAAGTTFAFNYSFPYLVLALFVLVCGSILGGAIGLLWLTYASRHPIRDSIAETRIPFLAPICGTFVALAVAMLLTFPATAAIWAHVKTEIPSGSLVASQTVQAMTALDGSVLTESPSLALYAYSFGHGVPLTARFAGSYAGQGEFGTTQLGQGSAEGIARMSLLGISAQEKNLGTAPAAPAYESWVYWLVLLPVIPLLVGGYVSAALSRGSGSLVLEGAKIAVPYALAMLGLAWLATLSVRADAAMVGLGSGSGTFALGPDLLFTAALALAWGATFGALGGWVRQLRASR
jgi:hypothetical protein